MSSNEGIQAQGGWGGPPGGGGYGPPPGGGGYGPPPGGGGYGAPPGGGYGGPPGGGYGPPPGGFGGPPGGFGGPPGGFGGPSGVPGGFGGPPGPYGAGPGGPPPPDLEGQLNTWFILSIVGIFFGCCLTGIIATVMTHGAKQQFAMGNYLEAQSKLGTAKTILIIGFVLGALGILLRIIAAAAS